MRINYTTYDVRRDQDIIHVGTPQSNVMLLNEASTNPSSPFYASIHPYLYAKVLGIYHANVSYTGKLPDGTQNLTAHRVDLVWVQWYDILESGKEFTLDRLSLRPVTKDDALGFLDPSDIIRSVHLIPQYSLGPPTTTSRAQQSKHVSAEDVWDAFYVNRWVSPLIHCLSSSHRHRFADRDLFMRYQYGMAVGHTYTRKMHASRMTIPSIPDDFEHSLTFPEGGATDEADEEGIYADPPSDESDGGDLEDDT